MRVINFFKILFVFLLLNQCYGIESELHIPEKYLNQSIPQGEFIEAELLVWPVNDSDLSHFENLENIKLSEELQVVSILSKKKSENNIDVAVFKLLLVTTQVKPNEIEKIKLNNTELVTKIPKISLHLNNAKTPSNFHVLDQEDEKPVINILKYFIYSLIFLIVLIILYVIFKKMKLSKKKIKIDWKANYILQIKSAKNRKDIEEIVLDRKNLILYLPELDETFNKFFIFVDQIQYKEKWTSDELNESLKLLDKIKGSIK